jgi:hypothetical protein
MSKKRTVRRAQKEKKRDSQKCYERIKAQREEEREGANER